MHLDSKTRFEDEIRRFARALDHFGGKGCCRSTDSTTSSGENKISNLGNFIILRSGKRETSFIQDHSAKFCSEIWKNDAFREVCILKIHENTFDSNLLVVQALQGTARVILGSWHLLFSQSPRLHCVQQGKWQAMLERRYAVWRTFALNFEEKKGK